MCEVKFAGTQYLTMARAAQAWALTALPDPRVIGADEDAEDVANKLEAEWWTEAAKSEQGAPEDVEIESWRNACRTALAQQIEEARSNVLEVDR